MIYWINLLFLCQGNVGLIFTKGDLKEVSEEVAKYKVRLLVFGVVFCNLLDVLIDVHCGCICLGWLVCFN